jgi:putative DNA primase/helicase
MNLSNLANEVKASANSVLNGSPSERKIQHKEVFGEILDALEPVNFRKLAKIKNGDKVPQKHIVVLTVRKILEIAKNLNCGLCKNYDFLYAYNGEFWQMLDRESFERFLAQCAERLGIDDITANYHKFTAELFKQFLAVAHLPKPETKGESVLINLQNGTFEITEKQIKIRKFRREDFLTYQLPFAFDKDANCPKWQRFLNEVIPDRQKQSLLAEYVGYVFARKLKLEKTLILYGTGANGKSVVFEMINALLGKENVSNYSLEALGEPYYRAMISDKLLNYASEISNRLQAEKFKQLTSGEPVEARLPYGQPMILTDYARLAFNCNDLPRDVEHTEAFFRRFLILTFDVTISAEKRNPNLAKEIIAEELSGVFNWVLEGLTRLLKQNNFSPCEAVQKALDEYRKESDSVAMFLDEESYETSQTEYILLKNLYATYRTYCTNNGYKPLGNNNFSKRLESNGITVEKKNVGKVVYVSTFGS